MPNLTTQQAADMLGVSRRRVSELIKLGTIKAEKFGRDWQVDAASVEAYKKSPRKAGRKVAQKPTNGTAERSNPNEPATPTASERPE